MSEASPIPARGFEYLWPVHRSGWPPMGRGGPSKPELRVAGKSVPIACIVEDDPDFRELERELLEELGYQVWALHTPPTAADIRRIRPNLVLLDLMIDGQAVGIDYMASLRQSLGSDWPPIVLCTANLGLVQQEYQRIIALAHAVLLKPFDLDDLINVAESCRDVASH